MSRRRLLSASLALSALLVAGCGTSTPPTDRPRLTVLAASSLTGVLERLPGAGDARISYAGSPTLVAQVRAGAPADVLITASEAALAPLRAAGLVGEPVLVATNSAVLVVPRANPGGVTGLPDLARADLRVALCDPAVPCGAVAAATLRAAGVQAAPDTLAPDVKTVLRLVSSGEADAGLVYASDSRAAGSAVTQVALAVGVAASTTYPATVVTASRHRMAAQAYVDSLRTAAARAVLVAAGFGPPP